MALAKSIPELSAEDAGKLLANIFDACDVEQNTIPLVKLTSYSEYRREKYSLQKVILIVILALFCIMPLCFVTPEFTVEKISGSDARYPVYEVSVGKLMPVSYVTATLDGKAQAVYETGERKYAVEVGENGLLDIKVAYINRQYRWKSELGDGAIKVEGIDVDAPAMQRHERTSGELRLWFREDGSGIDFENVAAYTADGTELRPIRWKEDENLIVFAFPNESVNIFVPDRKGNELQLVITIN